MESAIRPCGLTKQWLPLPNTFSAVPVISWNQLVSETPDGLPVERYLPASVHCIICQHCPLLSLAPTPPEPVPCFITQACVFPVRGPIHQKFFALYKFLLFILILVLFFFFFFLHVCMFVCGQRQFAESVVSTIWVPGIQLWGSKNLHTLRHIKNIRQRGWRHSP